MEALRTLLAEDARFSMPPWSAWWQGRETIAGFAAVAVEVCAVSRAVPVRANAQPALAYYSLHEDTGRWQATAIDVITLEGSQIKEVTAFVTPEAFARFGLPPELDP